VSEANTDLIKVRGEGLVVRGIKEEEHLSVPFR
jgi:hypothetical protein